MTATVLMAAVWDEASVGKNGLVTSMQWQRQNPSRYRLEIQQQPRLAYVSESSSKKAGKRPLDPPPIVRLRTQPEGIDENDDAAGSDDEEQNPAYSRLTHNLFLFATLLPEHARTTEDEVRQARNDLVTGTLFASLSQFRGQSCFAFPDLNVLAEGRWKFCMSLYGLTTSGVRFETSVVTEPFEVFSPVRFPLLDSSSEAFRNFFARPVQDATPKASFSAKPTSRSSVPRKPPKKPRAPPSQSFSSRPNQPCYTSLTHIPYQRQPRAPDTDTAATDSLGTPRTRILPAGAGNFSVYPRARPAVEVTDSDVPIDHSTEHFRLPVRRAVAGARPGQDPPPTAAAKNLAPVAQHRKPRSRPSRGHADFRNDELEATSVKRRRVASPPPVLAPLRACIGPPVGSVGDAPAASRRKSSSRAGLLSAGSLHKSKTATLASPSLPSTFADLLAAAAAVEKEDAAARTTKRNCPCRQPADAPCARELDPLPSGNGTRSSPLVPTKQDGSSSLSRLLGVGKDPKMIEMDQSPMFL